MKPASATIEPVAVKLEAAGLILSPTELIDPVAVRLEAPLPVRSASALIDPVAVKLEEAGLARNQFEYAG